LKVAAEKTRRSGGGSLFHARDIAVWILSPPIHLYTDYIYQGGFTCVCASTNRIAQIPVKFYGMLDIIQGPIQSQGHYRSKRQNRFLKNNSVQSRLGELQHKLYCLIL